MLSKNCAIEARAQAVHTEREPDHIAGRAASPALGKKPSFPSRSRVLDPAEGSTSSDHPPVTEDHTAPLHWSHTCEVETSRTVTRSNARSSPRHDGDR